MAELRLFPLDEILGAAEITKIKALLDELGVAELPSGDDVIDLDDVITDEQLADFMDRLEAHEIACDIYLPAEFEGRLEVGDQSLGSAYSLLEALEELKEELDIAGTLEADDEDADPEEEENELEIIDRQLIHAWHVFAKAAITCTKREVPLHVIA